MFSSWKLGRFLGIDLFIHWSFWLLPIVLVLSNTGQAEGDSVLRLLSLLFAMFGCVVLHEYGHALTARGFGIGTRDITLYPIGGVASLERMSEKPFEEFSIAIAGPLVNVAIALGIGLIQSVSLAIGIWDANASAYRFLSDLWSLNVWLVMFNMLPAFPMDGGRVLRALLARSMGLLPATRVAVALGKFLAIVFAVVGLLVLGQPSLAIIGFFIYMAGHHELFVLEYRQRRREAGAVPIVPVAENVWMHPDHAPRVQSYVWDPERRVWIRDESEATPAPW